MKNNLIIKHLGRKSAGMLLMTCLLFTSGLNAQKCDFYNLKIYSLANETQEKRMDDFLKHSFLPALHRADIQKVGVFKPIGNDTLSVKQVYVLIPFKTLDQFETLADVLDADKQYQTDGRDYIDALFDNAPYQRIESILMKAFKDMPEIGIPDQIAPHSERVYELRSYQGATEKIYQKKVHMFNEGGEIKLFEKLGFKPVFFGEVISGPSMPNLMYMTTFSNEAAQKEHWKAFQNHPDWKALLQIEQYKNTVSKMNVYMLRPVEYSDL